VKWNLEQCTSQAAGIARLEAIKATRPLTRQEKQVLAIAKAHFRSYGCKATLRQSQSNPSLILAGRSDPGVSPTNPQPTGSAMGLLDSAVGLVANVLSPGRANAVGPTPAGESPSLLENIGSIAGNVLQAVIPGGPVFGGAATLGTLGDTSTIEGGRAIAPVRLEAGGDISYAGDSTYAATGRRRLPASSKVRRLVHLVGVSNAASILGLSIPATAMIAVRPYRRRGISAASLRTTRRTIRAVNSINRSLSAIKSRGRGR